MNYSNKTEQVIIEALQAARVDVRYPITVNTSNKQDDYDVCCNYMSTGVRIPADKIDEFDFRELEEKQIFLHKTWHWCD